MQKRKRKDPGSRQRTRHILASTGVAFCFGHDPRQPAPGQCSLSSRIICGLQPSLVLMQTRLTAACVEMVNSLPSSFALLRFPSCFRQNSRREILRAKSPGPASTVKSKVPRPGEHCQDVLCARKCFFIIVIHRFYCFVFVPKTGHGFANAKP